MQSSARKLRGIQQLDAVDRHILNLLRRDGRASVSDIARAVGLSAAPVSRRIERLERTGVIKDYTAVIDEQQGGTLDAYTEIRLAGPTDADELAELMKGLPEVEAFYTNAGDPDALVRIRADSVDHLQRAVNKMRRTSKITATKTLIVMHSWTRADEAPRP